MIIYIIRLEADKIVLTLSFYDNLYVRFQLCINDDQNQVKYGYPRTRDLPIHDPTHIREMFTRPVLYPNCRYTSRVQVSPQTPSV